MLHKRICWRIILLTIGLFFLHGKGNAQLKGLWEELPSNGINFPAASAWYQDKRGVLRIGTSSGLFRYTGTEIVTYNDFPENPHFIPGNFIHKIVAVNDEQILIVGSGKLFLLNIART